jgi:hypothetical protein
MNTSQETIMAFVELAITRRRRALTPDDRSKIEILDQQLRDLIDGARPAPRKIEGHAAPAAAQATPARAASVQSRTSTAATPAAPVEKPKAHNVKALAEKLEISSTDKKKLTEVHAEDLPVSFYTPSKTPTFMHDYYSDDIVPVDVPLGAKPTAIVRADAGEVEVPREVKVLFGLEQAAPPVRVPTGDVSNITDPRRRSTPAPRAALDPETASRRRPVIVHMLAGGTRRGAVEAFEPSTGAINFFDDNGGQAQIALGEVLAVFFVQKKGEEPAQPSGQKVIVRLVNDRQVAGLTEDYAEGGDSLTLTPEQRRGNVDRVWIPAWAVKEIHLG